MCLIPKPFSFRRAVNMRRCLPIRHPRAWRCSWPSAADSIPQSPISQAHPILKVTQMSNTEDTAAKHNRRNRLLGILAAVVVVGIAGYALYWFLFASHFESTNDAYVGGDIISI